MPDEAIPPIPVEPLRESTGAGLFPTRDPRPLDRHRGRSPLGILLLVALIGFAVDQASKLWAFAPAGGLTGPRQVAPGLFTGVLARNDGAMANLASGRSTTAAICAMSALAITALAIGSTYQRRSSCPSHETFFVGLLSAGLLGNATDRLALGHVRDFLVATPLPGWIFNLADVFILIGALILLGSWALLRPRTSFAAHGELDGSQALPATLAGA